MVLNLDIWGKRMFKNLKIKYNKCLFKRYGLDKRIPSIFKLNPMWSPSLYHRCEGEMIVKHFCKGLEEGLKKHHKKDYSSECTMDDDHDEHCWDCTCFVFPIGCMKGENDE